MLFLLACMDGWTDRKQVLYGDGGTFPVAIVGRVVINAAENVRIYARHQISDTEHPVFIAGDVFNCKKFMKCFGLCIVFVQKYGVVLRMRLV